MSVRVDLFQPSGCSSEKHNREAGDGGDRGEDEGGGGGDGASRLIVSSRVHECWEWSETTDRLTHPHQTAQISKSPRRPRPHVCRVTVMEIINTDGVFTT